MLLGVLAVLAVYAHLTHPTGRFTRGGRPHGDGLYHYAQVRSLVLDGDLRLANDYARLGNPHGQPVRADGYAGNHFTVGTALGWIPSFAVAHGVSRIGNAAGFWEDPADGTSALCQRGTMMGSVVMGWLALVLIARMLRVWFEPRAVGLAVVLAAMCTPLWWYMTRQPSASHAASAFAVAGLLHATVRGGPSLGLRRGAVLGAWLAFVALVRPQDIVFAVWPLGLVVGGLFDRAQRRSAAIGLVAMLGVAALGFAPQAWVWSQTYGSALVVPQGPGFMLWADSQWSEVLWSTRGGLFAWSPAVFFAVLGLVIAAVAGPARWFARVMLVSFALAVFICGAVDDWWGGWAFGARRLVGATAVLAWGFAALSQRVLAAHRRWMTIVMALVCLATLRLSMQMQDDYLFGRVERGQPQSLAPVWSRAFGLPLDDALERIGTPGSWPANWVFAARTGATAGQYDRTVGWALVRARGDAKGYDRLWLEDDRWALSGLGPLDDAFAANGRTIEDEATIGIPLRRPLALHGRVRLWTAQPTTVTVEGWGPSLSLPLRVGAHDYPLPLRTRAAGFGFITLRTEGDTPVGVVFVDIFEPGHDPTAAAQ